MDTQPQVSRSFVHASHGQPRIPRNENDSPDNDSNPSESQMSLETEVAETQLYEPMQTTSASAQPIASTEESAKSYKTKKTKIIRSRSYSRSPSSSDDDYPAKKSKLSEPVPDSLITLVQRASIHPPAPGEASSGQPSTSKTYAPPQRERRHYYMRGRDSVQNVLLALSSSGPDVRTLIATLITRHRWRYAKNSFNCRQISCNGVLDAKACIPRLIASLNPCERMLFMTHSYFCDPTSKQ
ncbi:unnamed protein product [Cylicocyclus nassatus]|uniref:Uncharacterized protein n=1 Tax=Cylicocyclus nassatus TaxID=53992 RepID=A0AA36DRN9_CYLNA|nr:unnamed protein product [Cylicocyclus nassatus]